jgi:hypothetical protein
LAIVQFQVALALPIRSKTPIRFNSID